MTVVAVHPDTASLELHLEIGNEEFRKLDFSYLKVTLGGGMAVQKVVAAPDLAALRAMALWRVAVQRELGVPVKLVGIGEGADDLAPFEPEAFADALLGDEALHRQVADASRALVAESFCVDRVVPLYEATLARMGEVTVDDFYSLCGRLDTIRPRQ